uniref:C2H2-type domain-containing protein n=1 Tax=Astatotilapia calliptera TaxID=8154 RepID=A0AAX7UUE2_ASTCA
MSEVSVKVDEDVIKQDPALEPLAEPLLIILSPPPPFLPVHGEPALLWSKWLKAFEHYVEALSEKELVDSSKCLLLQNCLGPEGQRIFTTLIQNDTTYAAAISTLTAYFSSDHTTQMHRLKFHQRAQMPGETVDQFVSALEELLRPCSYGHLKDELLLNQLIEKTSYPQLRERLLNGRESLTLTTALVIGKEVETLLNGSQLFDIHEVSVDIGDDLEPPVQRKAKRGRKASNGECFTCPDCQTDFAFVEDLNKHLEVHVKENKGTCPKCDETFGSLEELEVHMAVHQKSYSCSTCGKKFKVEYLTEHMSSHEGEQPQTCSVCGRTFLNKNKLEKHLTIHTGERPHLCSICGNGFPSAASLKLHVHIHTGEKPYQCSQCSKSFRSSSGLRLHSRQHMEVRPSYECPQCGRTYGHEKPVTELLFICLKCCERE